MLRVFHHPHQAFGLGGKVQVIVAGALLLNIADGILKLLFCILQITVRRKPQHTAQYQQPSKRTDQNVLLPADNQ